MAKRDNSSDIINMVLIVVFLLIAIVVLYYINGTKLLETFYSKKYAIEYYYMEGCGHCVRFNESGVWEDLKNTYENKIEFKKYNNRDAIDKINKYGITGFPTIIITENGNKKEEYNGNRGKADLEIFIKKYL